MVEELKKLYCDSHKNCHYFQIYRKNEDSTKYTINPIWTDTEENYGCKALTYCNKDNDNLECSKLELLNQLKDIKDLLSRE